MLQKIYETALDMKGERNEVALSRNQFSSSQENYPKKKCFKYCSASTPSKTAVIEIAIPIIPTNIPTIITNPSFPSRPKEIIKTPRPGIKFESGKGNKTKKEKSSVKIPIIRSAV